MRHTVKQIAVHLVGLCLRWGRRGPHQLPEDLNNRAVLISAMIGLGNSVLTLPMIATLRKKYPHISIDVLTKDQSSSAIFQASGLIDEVHVCSGTAIAQGRLLIKMRRKTYDLAFVTFPTLSLPQELLPFFLKVKEVVIHDYGALHPYFEKLKQLYLYCPAPSSGVHDIEQNSNLLSHWIREKEWISFYPVVTLPEQATARITSYLSGAGMGSSTTMVGIHPGSRQGAILKRWPVENYLALAQRLQETAKVQTVFFLGPDESEMVDRIKDLRFLVFQSGSLFEVMALLRKCSLFISNDSGIMHTAALCEIPLLTVWGGTDESRNAGRSRNVTNVLPEGYTCRPCIGWIPRHPCPHLPNPCVGSIGVSRVLDIALRLLKS